MWTNIDLSVFSEVITHNLVNMEHKVQQVLVHTTWTDASAEWEISKDCYFLLVSTCKSIKKINLDAGK